MAWENTAPTRKIVPRVTFSNIGGSSACNVSSSIVAALGWKTGENINVAIDAAKKCVGFSLSKDGAYKVGGMNGGSNQFRVTCTAALGALGFATSRKKHPRYEVDEKEKMLMVWPAEAVK